MSTPSMTLTAGVEARARQSLGSSHAAIYQMVAAALERHHASRGRIVDVGCGSGGLFDVVGHRFDAYCGLDAVRYDGLPTAAEFHRVDLDADQWPALPSAGVVVAIETIEHLENPWAFMRQLSRLTDAGGLVVVTTPNQLSLLSLVTLIARRRFSAFQDAHYPTHRTALLESDLVRAATESGLEVIEVGYTHCGRLPLMPWHYPAALARLLPRRLSDNLMIVARRSRG